MTTLDLARAEIGVVESPPNSNRTKYGAWYGLDGNPWCAMFVSWLMHFAGIGNLYRFAAVASSIAAAKRNGTWRQQVPRAGWVACKLYTSTTGHTGIVESVVLENGVWYVYTIEGNTSYGDDRNGGIVMRRKRSLSWWLGFIELPLGGGAAPAPPPAPAPAPVDSRTQRIMGLQRAVGTTVDGDFGPKTRAACAANYIGWVEEVRRRGSTAIMRGNSNRALVSWFKSQLNRRFAAGLDPANMAIGPAVNHHIVVSLGQRDGIAGPDAFLAACG